jgi:hypothetical protein
LATLVPHVPSILGVEFSWTIDVFRTWIFIFGQRISCHVILKCDNMVDYWGLNCFAIRNYLQEGAILLFKNQNWLSLYHFCSSALKGLLWYVRLISLFPFVRLNLVIPFLNLKMIIGCSSILFDFGGLISNYHGLHWSFLFNLQGVWDHWVMVPLLCYAMVVFFHINLIWKLGLWEISYA